MALKPAVRKIQKGGRDNNAGSGVSPGPGVMET